MKIYTNEIFLEHDTGAHPENAHRLEHTVQNLLSSDSMITTVKDWKIQPQSMLLNSHSPQQINLVKSLAGGSASSQIDQDTIVSPQSFDVALMAVSAGCAAVESTLNSDEASLCLVRPPGHHATDQESMGFCLFNNIAVASQFARSSFDIERILIVDWDVHHGNGTQDIFYQNENIFYYSMHRYPFYPGTGHESETGSSTGLGFTSNCPISFGTSRAQILEQFQSGLENAARKIKPQLIMISAGFDAHRLDPIGCLDLEAVDFAHLTRQVQNVADIYCPGKIISFLEGGYNPVALSESVNEHIASLIEKP